MPGSIKEPYPFIYNACAVVVQNFSTGYSRAAPPITLNLTSGLRSTSLYMHMDNLGFQE